MLKDYFNLSSSEDEKLKDFKIALSANDIERIIDWQCEKSLPGIKKIQSQAKTNCWSFFLKPKTGVSSGQNEALGFSFSS